MNISFTKDMKTVIKNFCEEKQDCMSCPFYNEYYCVAFRYFNEETEAPCDWAVD